MISKRKAGGKKFKLIILLLLAFLLVFRGAFKLSRNLYEFYKIKKYERELRKENEKLKKEMELIKKDEFIEYSARTGLGLKKDEEIEYRFTPPSKKDK